MLSRARPRLCQDCKETIRWTLGARFRRRCDRCTLKHWRAAHPDKVAAQRHRYQQRAQAYVRELGRLRVAKWRERQRALAAEAATIPKRQGPRIPKRKAALRKRKGQPQEKTSRSRK